MNCVPLRLHWLTMLDHGLHSGLDPEFNPEHERELEPFEPAHQETAAISSVAPWDFLDLVFTAMIVIGSLALAEVVVVIFLAMHQVLNGGHLGDSLGLARKLTDARFILPIQLFSDA